ncbi:MAG TPA: uracil-DNA glycosylase [candidate division Zixibacteria bacterium]|nr:uracil-DNA glycosylase [candidate division Zixibacteria bacterium]
MISLRALNREIVGCRKCPRLVRWREQVGKNPPRRYRGTIYWARPLPGFGDPRARLLVVGLAPAAHGGNRTGRIFTGDRSGDWLYEALYHAGFANQPRSEHRGDGLKLRDCYITAAVRCAPPANKPSPAEFRNCRPYLVRELKAFRDLRVVVALGKIAFDSFLAAFREAGGEVPRPRPRFGHGSRTVLPGGVTLLGSYHPSQQNTFTGRLTREMLAEVFAEARKAIAKEPGRRGREKETEVARRRGL